MRCRDGRRSWFQPDGVVFTNEKRSRPHRLKNRRAFRSLCNAATAASISGIAVFASNGARRIPAQRIRNIAQFTDLFRPRVSDGACRRCETYSPKTIPIIHGIFRVELEEIPTGWPRIAHRSQVG